MARDRSIKLVIQAQVDGAKRALRETADAAKRVGEEADSASKRSSSASGRMVQSARDNSQAWGTAGATLTAFGAASAVAMGGSAKAAIDWESAWTGVNKTVDGSATQMAALEAELRGMARTLPATHGEIAAVAEAAGQLGVKREDVAGFTRTMIDLGESTNLSADEAATSIAQMANVMGTSGDDVSRLGSALVELGNNGASTERDIMQMATRLAGAGNLVGATESDVLALANTMSSLGIEAQLGGGVMSRVLQQINSEVISGGDNLQGFAQVAGMSASEFAAAWKADPVAALDGFIQGLAGIQNAGGDTVGMLSDLGIKGTENTSVLLRLTGAGDMLTESLDQGAQAWESNSALSEEAGKRYETVASKMQVAKNNIVDAGISLGEVLMPAIEGITEAASSAAGFLAGMPEPLQEIAAGAGVAAAGFGLIGGGLLLTVPKLIETRDAFKQLESISPRLSRGLGNVSRAAGIAGGAFVALQVAASFLAEDERPAEGIEATTTALLDLRDAADAASVEKLFSGLGSKDLITGRHEIEGMADALDRAFDPGVQNRINDFGDGLFRISNEGDTVRDQFDMIGQSLARMMAEGNTSQAEAVFAALSAGAQDAGYSTEQLLSLMPAYAEALAAVENEARLAGEGSEVAAVGIARLASATAGWAQENIIATGALSEWIPMSERARLNGEEAAKAYAEWAGEMSGLHASFIDSNGALQAADEQTRVWAEGQAELTEDATDSWEDYVENASFALDTFLAELEEQATAQAQWHENMMLLQTRLSDEALQMLEEMGPAGAQAAAALVDAGDAELARFDAVAQARFGAIPDRMAENMADADVVLTAAAARWGQGISDEIAAKLGSGETTAAEVVAAYDLQATIDLLADPANFNTGLATSLALADGEEAVPDLNLDPGLFNAGLGAAIGRANAETGVPDLSADPRLFMGVLATSLAKANISVGTPDIAGVATGPGLFMATLASALREADTSTGTAKIDANDRLGRGVLSTFLRAVDWAEGTVDVDARTTDAKTSIDAFFRGYRGVQLALKLLPGFADGGLIQRANGGLDQAGHYVARQPMMGGPAYGRTNIMWGEPETGWEAYISGKPGMEARNRAVLEEAARRMGMTVLDGLDVPRMRFASGGMAIPGMSATFNASTGPFDEWRSGIQNAASKWFLSDQGGTSGRAGKGMPWQAIWALIRSVDPGAVMTSNYRPGARTAGYGNTSLHAMGRAVDVVSSNMMRTFMLIKGLRPWTELIYTPAGPLQERNGRNYWERNPRTMADHIGHIHAAMDSGGIIDAIRGAQIADTGFTTLKPGWNFRYNGLGRDEHMMDVRHLAVPPAAQSPAPDFSALSAAADKILAAASAIPDRIEVPVRVGAREVARAGREGEHSYGPRAAWGQGPQSQLLAGGRS